jgi:hypothetical protein
MSHHDGNHHQTFVCSGYILSFVGFGYCFGSEDLIIAADSSCFSILGFGRSFW